MTNRELLILTGENPLELIIHVIDDALLPEGFKHIDDYVILWQEKYFSDVEINQLHEFIYSDIHDHERAKWIECKQLTSRHYEIKFVYRKSSVLHLVCLFPGSFINFTHVQNHLPISLI